MRSFIRHPSDIPIEYQADESGSNIEHEHLNDVSRGGLSFSATHRMVPGTLITIRIGDVEPDFEARAKVAWCRPDGENFIVGVAFTESSDLFRMRMVEQICHIEHYKASVLATEGRHIDGEQAAREWIQKYAHGFPVFEDE